MVECCYEAVEVHVVDPCDGAGSKMPRILSDPATIALLERTGRVQ
jgi:hypothetical protein